MVIVFLTSQVYAGDYLSPKSNPPSKGALRYLRVLISGAGEDIREIASTWNPIKIGLQTEINPNNIRQRGVLPGEKGVLPGEKGVLPEATLPRLNQAFGIIKERSSRKRFRDLFNLDVYPKKGFLGKQSSERYLLQNLIFFEGPFLADMLPGYDEKPQTSMLNTILFTDLVRSIETLIFVLRHEMDHANPITERQIKDRDLLYFSNLPKEKQDEIIDDLGRIEKAVKVAQDSILAGAYKERTGEDLVGKLQRYKELLLLAQREGLSERSKDAIREYVGMRRCQVRSFDGVPISYTIGGNLESPITLLFLHGWTLQSKDWRRQIAEFENEYKIVTVDTRGFGRSGQGDYTEEHPPNIDDWVRDIEEVIKKENLKNIVVLGHSMGGMIGFKLALKCDSIIGFIPIATTATRPSRSFINSFYSELLERLGPAFMRTLHFLTRPKVVDMLGKIQRGWLRNNFLLEALARVPSQRIGLTTQKREEFHHLWTNCVGSTNLRDWVISLLAMYTYDVVDRLRDIKIPVLWFIGGRDKMVLPDVQEGYARVLPDAKVLTFDESGHFSHWEEPKKVNEAIREFLEDKIRPTVIRRVLATADGELAGLEGNPNFKIITTWQEVDRYIEGLIRKGEKPLRILVDLDMTVFTPCGYLGSDIWLKQRIEEIGIYHALWEWGDHERRVERCGFYRLADPRIPEIIERWKEKGIEIVGFTAREWHKDSHRTQRILRILGISFSHTTSVPGVYSDGGVVYTYGRGVRKAKALKGLIKGAAGPTIVIDDTPGNIAGILRDKELKKCHGLLYCNPTIEQFLKKEAQEYIRLGDEAMEKGQFDFAIEYYFNAVEQARGMDPVQKSSAIRQIWQRVEKLNLDGQDTEGLVRFLIQHDETKYDLRIMDKRLRDPYLNLLSEKPPVKDPERSRILSCWINESTDLNNLKYTLRVLRGIHKKDDSPKFRIVLRSGSPLDKMRRKMRESDLYEGIDYDLWFVPKEEQTLISTLKKKFRDLVSVTDDDVITIGTTGEPLFNNQSIYEGIAKAEEYSIPAEPYSEVSPFSRIDLVALREMAKKKQEFFARHKEGEHKEGEPIVLFYHNDSDGIASASAETVFIREYLGDEIKIVYVPIDHYEPLHIENIPRDGLWIVLDFSYVGFSQKLASLGISKKEILFQDHHDEDEPEIPDGIIYISPKGLRSDLGSGRYPAGLLTTIMNAETLRQSKDLTSAALYLEKTNWISALAIYGDYCGQTWSGYLSIYGLDKMHLDELAERITAVACVDPAAAGLPLMDIINLSRTTVVRGSPGPTARLGEGFESRAKRVYQQLRKVINKIKREQIIFYMLTPEDLEEGDISIMLVDYLLANFKCKLVLIGVEKRIGDKRVLILHARSTGLDAGRLMQKVSASGGGHAKAGGAKIELKKGESGIDVFERVKKQIEEQIKPTGSEDEVAFGTRVKGGKFSIVADIGPNWSRYGEEWGDFGDKFKKAMDDILGSGEFKEADIKLIQRITLVSGNDKLATCNRAEGQVILDVRAFKKTLPRTHGVRALIRLELIHELWHLKLADLRRKGKLTETNILIEEMFTILNQIKGFISLPKDAQKLYLDALREDTDESEEGLYKILLRVRGKRIKDIRACLEDVRGLVLNPKAFNFSDKAITEFKKLTLEEIEGRVNILFELKDALKYMDGDTIRPEDIINRYTETRREIKSVLRLKGEGRVPRGKNYLARISLRPDGFIKESHFKKHGHKFTSKDLVFLEQALQQVSLELKEKFMQINVEELEIFKDLEILVVDDSDHLIYYWQEDGKRKLVLDKRAFDSKELLIMELERIIGEVLMYNVAKGLPPTRLEVVYSLYLSVERFLRFPNEKQEEILTVLKEKFPENIKFHELLLKIKGKDPTIESQWEEIVKGIIDFIFEEGIYPKDVQETLKMAGLDRLKKFLIAWVHFIESRIQIELAFRSHDPQMRNMAISYLVKNAKKLRFEEILLDNPNKTVSLGSTKLRLGEIVKFDKSIRCLRSSFYPERLILVNAQDKFLLIERLTSSDNKPYLRISNRSYRLETETATVNLTGILQEPRLWMGNYSLVDFWGNRFEGLLNQLRRPPPSGITLEPIPPDIARLTRRVVSPQVRIEALNYLKNHPLPSSQKTRKQVSPNTILLHIHCYLTLMSTGDINDFISAQKGIEELSKDKSLNELINFLLGHLGISKQFNVLSGLNEQQYKAVTAPNGPTIVIAGAGTGKTRVIVRRLAYVMSSQEDVKPENILAITFTQKAAEEIAQRVENMVGVMRERIQISTFHSFGYRMLQDYGYLIGLPHNIRVLDEVEQWQFFRSLLPELKKPKKPVLRRYWKRQDPSDVISWFIDFINRAKDNLIGPDEFMEYAKTQGNPELIEVAEVYKIYQDELLARGYLDYGDLISYPVKLLQGQPDIKARYQEQYKHILVDEFQDTNYSQIKLLELLGNNIFVVGDDDQSIYQFRGASDASFRLFHDIYPQANRFKLTQNYRSSPNIIECANRLISNNEFRFDPQKNLWTTGEKGEPVEIWVSPDYRDEAVSIADEIQKIYEDTKDYSQIAVLYRAHRHNRELISALEARGIPYVVKGGIPLLRRREIRDLIAYMRFINDPSDFVSFFRILQTPRFKIPDSKWVELAELMEKKEYSPWDLLENLAGLSRDFAIKQDTRDKLKRLREYLVELMELSMREDVRTVFNRLWQGYLEDLALRGKVKGADANIRKFSDFIEAYLEINPERPSLANFMEHLETYILAGGDPERELPEEKPVNAVQLMTVHRAKGLEFPYVFLINLSQKRFPSSFQADKIPMPSSLSKTVYKGEPTKAHKEEERRTMYVGMNRAQKKLYLCGVEKKYHPLSQFIKEVLALGERKGVLLSKKIPESKESFVKEEHPVLPALRQEVLNLRQQLVAAIKRLGREKGEKGVRPHFLRRKWGLTPFSRDLLNIFRICLAIAQTSLMVEHPDVKECQKRLNKFQEWTTGMLATKRDKLVTHAMGQGEGEILGAIPIAQPGELELPTPKRFSFTQISTYLGDPQRYKERYILGIPGFEPENVALKFGKLIHELLESVNRSLEKGEPIPLDRLKQDFFDRLRQVFPELRKRREFKDYIRRGYKILEDFYKRKENEIKPIGIEHEFELQIGEDLIFGYIDCIRELPDGKLQIIDYKTGSSEEGFKDKYRLQLLIYGLWAHREFGKKPEDIVLTNYYVEEDKHVTFTPTHDELMMAEGIFRKIIDRIKRGIFEEVRIDELKSEISKEPAQEILPEFETTLENIIKDLDEPQSEAVTTTEGPLLVLGAPGTGKTLTLLRRAAYILHSRKDIKPENILILTNSRESVDEFREGLEPLVGKSNARKVSVSTPRNISWQILRSNAGVFGIPERFWVANKADQKVVLRRLWPGLDIKYHAQISRYPDIVDKLIDYFHRLQSELIFADDYLEYADRSDSEQQKELARIYKAWEDAMRRLGIVGNEQLVPLTVKMLLRNPEVLSSYKDRFNYLLVNRLQDLDFAEFTLMELLAGKSKNVCAVGDENMGVGNPRIDPRRNFKLFREKFPDSKTIFLRQNYRSTRTILTVAKKMLDSVYAELDMPSPIAEYSTTGDIGEKVGVIVAGDPQEEARAIVEEIKRIYAQLPQDRKDYRRFAVLTKTISAQKYIVEALENENIPYAWDIEKSLFDREEIKDLMALIPVFLDKGSQLELTRFLMAAIPHASAIEVKRILGFMKSRGVSLKVVLNRIDDLILSPETKQGLLALKGLFAKLQDCIDDIGLFLGEWFKQTGILKGLAREGTPEADTKVMNLGRFVRLAKRFAGVYPTGKSVEKFWDYLQDYRKSGGYVASLGLIGEPHGVYVSTITRAGDRGFHNVFISGINKGSFPVVPPEKGPFEIPEELTKEPLLSDEYSFLQEARLLYLGMTKARGRLYITGLDRDGLSKFLRVILEESPQETEYKEIESGEKVPPLTRFQRLYMTYQEQLIQLIDTLAKSKTKKEWERTWQEIVDTIWNLARLGATQETVPDVEKASAKIESIDKILARIIKTHLPRVLKKELTPSQRKRLLDWLRFPKRFIEEFPVPEDFRLSYTRIEAYEGCPYTYKLKYVFKIPEKTTAALTFGKVMHEVMEYIYNRMNEGKKPTLGEILQFYKAKWSSEGYEDKVQERDYWEFGLRIIKGYYYKNIRGLKPDQLPKTELEKEFTVKIGGIPVLGYIDKIEIAEGNVLDYKTGTPKTQKDADKSLQLTIYAYAYSDMFGKLPELSGFYNLTNNERVTTKRTQKDLDKLEGIVPDIARKILAQMFPPKEGFRCKWCRFKEICPVFEAGAKIIGPHNPGNPGLNPGNPGSDSKNPAPSDMAKKATSVFLETIRAENIQIRLRKTILVWDTDIRNSQQAMGLLAKLESSNLGNIHFIKGKAGRLKTKIDDLKEEIGEDVDIVVVSKVENKERLREALGEGDVYITTVDDKNIDPTNYLPILELLSFAMKIVFEDDVDKVKQLYEEITKKPLTSKELKMLKEGTASIILPPAKSMDYKTLKKIYELSRKILESA